MLTLRAAKEAEYYERPEFAADDYYAERGQVRGTWAGRGAQALGLSGAPSEGDLGVLLEGRNARSGAVLAGTARRIGGNVAFDLTFAAPKSVSVLAAVGDQDVRAAVIEAHARGVDAALDYLERQACFVRRGRNGLTVLPAEGFVGALYVHEMARSGDPHLHAHLVIANRVRGPDGRWSAPDMRPVYAHAKTAGTIADAVMRAELSRSLGPEWGPVGNGIAELAAVPAAVREHFSGRHAEIMEEATARGLTSMAGIAAIQRETRDRKRVVDRREAVAGWRARAAEHGFGEHELARALGRARPIGGSGYTKRLRAHATHMLGPEGLTRQSSTFTRREVIQQLADVHPEGAPAGRLERLADQFLARACVPLTDEDRDVRHREPLYTTPDMLAAEVRLLEAATGHDPRGPVTADPRALEAAIAARPSLGGDQAAAVRHLASGVDRVRVMEARAGTGKTFTLAALREAYRYSGVPVVGVAWQGQAADVLQREAGIPSQTAALLLARVERGDDDAIPHRAVVVVDEASVMPTRSLERLVQAAAWASARVVLVGDRAQLPSIDAGGGFAALADHLGAVELTENRRQATELQRRIAGHLAEGRAADAVALLSESGRLQSFEDARDARIALVTAWAQAEMESPGRNLMLAHDRHDVAELNRLAREWREAWGFISDRRITVSGTEWAIGDRMVCRRNDYALGVRNGTQGTVVDLGRHAEHLDLLTDHDETIRIPADYLAHARHGYALTGHVSQGESVDRTFVLASPERGGAEWAYVAGSRQRHDLQVFVTHHEAEGVEEALARAWSRSQAKSLALELVDPAARESAMDAVRGNLDGATPERLIARVEELRAARASARDGATGAPNHQLVRVAGLRAAVARAREGAEDAEARLARLAQRIDHIPAWRRRDRTRARSDIERARRDLERHRRDGRAAQGELARLGSVDGSEDRQRAQRLGVELSALESRLAPWRDSPEGARTQAGRDRAPAQRVAERALGHGR
ncbi:MAG: MobF family relaxase [Thermoleophilia bacterium]